MTVPVSQSYRGVHAFGSLQAEHESIWLHQVFVEPADFAAMASGRSVVALGESGAGKTTLRLALAMGANPSTGSPSQLVVDWRPTLPPPDLAASQAVSRCFVEVLDACAWALLGFIGRRPERFKEAALWVQETIRWFIHRYMANLSGDRELLLNRLTEQATLDSVELIGDIIRRKPREVLRPDTSEPRLIAELANVVQQLGLDGVWVMVDGLERLLDLDSDGLSQVLKALFSTLALFENPGFSVKVVAPVELESPLMASSGVARRRIDVHRLRWNVRQLAAIVERRIAWLLQRPFELAELYSPDKLVGWLERYGGLSPRGWLELMRPFVQIYQERGASRALTSQEWERTVRADPPQLRIDTTSSRVYVGQGEVRDLQPTAQKLLNHLYEHRDRLCTRSELYYRALLELPFEPRSLEDAGYQSPAVYEGQINTLLWRLRQVIEPFPDRPVYVVTERGKGIRLYYAI